MIDDIIDQKMSAELLKCFLTYRNARISIIFCIQDDKLLHKSSRYNVNNILFFQPNNDIAAKSMIDTYLNSFLPTSASMLEKIRWLREVTANHGFIYLDQYDGKFMSVHSAI